MDARRLFESLDPVLWSHSHHNPVHVLSRISPERLAALAADPGFVRHYSAVMKAYDEYHQKQDTWFASHHSGHKNFLVGYFSAEFGFHISIPIYSGGLGILAGDHCKEASDLGIPLVGLGFMYPQGYFRQRLTPDGWQEAEYASFDRNDSPIHRVLGADGAPSQISVEMAGRRVAATIWKIGIGRISLYLLDTDVPQNAPEDRGLSARLYGGGQEMRLCQEILLGIGGSGPYVRLTSPLRFGTPTRAIRHSSRLNVCGN